MLPGPAPPAIATYLLDAGSGAACRAISLRRPVLPNQSSPRRPDGGLARPIHTYRRAEPVSMATEAGAAVVPRGCRTVRYPAEPYCIVPRHRAPQVPRGTPRERLFSSPRTGDASPLRSSGSSPAAGNLKVDSPVPRRRYRQSLVEEAVRGAPPERGGGLAAGQVLSRGAVDRPDVCVGGGTRCASRGLTGPPPVRFENTE